MNKSGFDKTLENIRNKVDIRVIASDSGQKSNSQAKI